MALLLAIALVSGCLATSTDAKEHLRRAFSPAARRRRRHRIQLGAVLSAAAFVTLLISGYAVYKHLERSKLRDRMAETPGTMEAWKQSSLSGRREERVSRSRESSECHGPLEDHVDPERSSSLPDGVMKTSTPLRNCQECEDARVDRKTQRRVSEPIPIRHAHPSEEGMVDEHASGDTGSGSDPVKALERRPCSRKWSNLSDAGGEEVNGAATGGGDGGTLFGNFVGKEKKFFKAIVGNGAGGETGREVVFKSSGRDAQKSGFDIGKQLELSPTSGGIEKGEGEVGTDRSVKPKKARPFVIIPARENTRPPSDMPAQGPADRSRLATFFIGTPVTTPNSPDFSPAEWNGMPPRSRSSAQLQPPPDKSVVRIRRATSLPAVQTAMSRLLPTTEIGCLPQPGHREQ